MLYCFCHLHNLSQIPDDYGSDQNQAVTEKRSAHTQQGGNPTKKRLKTYKQLRNHSQAHQTGNLSDDNDETMDCDTKEDPQFAIFMEAQARL